MTADPLTADPLTAGARTPEEITSHVSYLKTHIPGALSAELEAL
jgi:hypothetical protein